MDHLGAATLSLQVAEQAARAAGQLMREQVGAKVIRRKAFAADLLTAVDKQLGKGFLAKNNVSAMINGLVAVVGCSWGRGCLDILKFWCICM